MHLAVELFVVAEAYISPSTCVVPEKASFASAFLIKMDAVLLPYSLDYEAMSTFYIRIYLMVNKCSL
uniref:Uncharacterized protein n=1 Tax=Triticum urartu TaxID=4572 RepID=A0A8R7PGS6_TRIUA